MGEPVIVTVPRGLQTEQGRIAGSAPVLVEAENVVCRRPGLVEPRGQLRSWVRASATAATDTGTCVHARRWTNPNESNGGSCLYYFTGNADDEFIYRFVPGGTASSGITTVGRTQEPRSADLGDRLAWCMDMGIGMVDDLTLSPLKRPPGVPQGPTPGVAGVYTGTVAEEWFPTTGAVAYRTCIVRIINGRPTRGAPSPRIIHRQDTAGTAYLRLTIPITDLDFTGTDVIEIYRTQTITTPGADPGDEMRLRYTATIANFVNYVTFDDFLPDDAWNGPFLYTNETAKGITQANARPNMAHDVALYNGMTCYAQAESWPTLYATLRTSGDCAVPSESLVSVAFDATTGALSDTLTAVDVAAFPYLAVGQIVTLVATTAPTAGDATFPALAKIVSFDAGAQTITLDSDAITTGAVVAVAWDWFAITSVLGNVSYVLAYPTVNVSGAGTIPTFDNYASTAVFFPNAGQAAAPWWSGGAGEICRAYDFYGTAVLGVAADEQCNVQIRIDGFDIGPQDVTQTNARGMALRFFVDCDDWERGITDDNYGQPQLVTFGFTTTKPLAWDVADNPSTTFGPSTPATSTTLGGVNRVAVSKVDQPESVPLANFYDIGGTDYPIRRIVATTDSLWVLKGDGLWRMYGDTPQSMAVQQVDPTCRMFGRDTNARYDRWVTKLGDTVFAWTDLGIVAISAGGVERIDDQIRSLVQKYTPGSVTSGAPSVTRPWSWSSLSTGTVALGFDAHVNRSTPLGFVYDIASGTWSTMSTTDIPAILDDVVTVDGYTDDEIVVVDSTALRI
jgi:hypothetical protein